MRVQPSEFYGPAEASHQASVVRTHCLKCNAPVHVQTDGYGHLLELEVGTDRIHRCKGRGVRRERRGKKLAGRRAPKNSFPVATGKGGAS